MTTRRPRRSADHPPLLVIAVAAIGSGLFVLPLIGLLWRAPWSSFLDQLRDQSVRTAIWLSLECSLASTAIAVAFGVPLAWVLARTSFPGKRLLRSLLTLPMVLPPVVGGMALLLAFGRRGLVGQWLFEWFGWRFAFTTAGVVMAETFVAMPFFVVAVEAALRSLDPRFEDAARALRASRITVLRTVTLPLIAPSLAAGAVLCWARALGEFGATITFAANVEGETQTIPLKVYLALETNPEAAIVLGIILLALSVGVLVALRDRWMSVR